MQPNPVKEALEMAVGYITDAMAEAQAEYELNAPYPLRAKQFEARLESINADLEKVQRALTQPAIPEGWRDISTAPKDGTKIILYPFMQSNKIFVGYFTDLYDSGVWYATEHGHLNGMLKPTHWQPLPAAPVSGNLEG
jgi:hypothetical protein